MMPYEVLTVPFDTQAACFSTDDMKRFCMNKEIKRVDAAFFVHAGEPYWSFFVEYEALLEPAGRETESLTDGQRACFERLREWRKAKAEERACRKTAPAAEFRLCIAAVFGR